MFFDEAIAIRVEHLEGLLYLLRRQKLLEIDGSNYELRVVDLSVVVAIDFLDHGVYVAVVDDEPGNLGDTLTQLLLGQYSVVVLVHSLECGHELLLVLFS